MKKFVFIIVACLAIAIFFIVNPHSTAQQVPVIQNPDDVELAETIKRLTNRSTEGLVEEGLSDGSYGLDLQGRFQNVFLATHEPDGEIRTACVTGLAEANDFFGRNLETGESVPQMSFKKNETADVAARHGMSEKEFEFYKNMIEEAMRMRAASPNSATLAIVNNDGAGEGFNDPASPFPDPGNTPATRGQQRLNLFNTAAGIWGAFLDSSVTVNVRSQFNPLLPCSPAGGVLGSASTVSIWRDFPNAEFPGTWYSDALANKRMGVDLDPASPEINATFNTNVDNGCLGAGTRFYYGLNNATPAGTVNLLVVLLHEMGHGLGFQSFVNGSTGTFIGGFPDIYTRYMYDRSVGLHWYQMTNAERQASALNVGNVVWNGPNVKIASGFMTNGRDPLNGCVQLFTPNPLQSGSSISHFDTAASPNLLMEPAINLNLPLDLDLTRQQMRDIGWYRDTTSDLVPDTITNVQVSGTTFTPGTTANVTWTNNGGFNRNVTIELSINGGFTFPITLASDVANTSPRSVTVPGNVTTAGRVRVREHNFVAPAGASTTNFSIACTPQPIKYGQTKTGNLQAGDCLYHNDNSFYDAWTFSGHRRDRISITLNSTPLNFDAYLILYRGAYPGGTVETYNNNTTTIPLNTNARIPAGSGYYTLTLDGNQPYTILATSLSQGQTGAYTLSLQRESVLLKCCDFDGDGKQDMGVIAFNSCRFCQSQAPNLQWWIFGNSPETNGVVTFGVNTDKATPADYTGDGRTDIAVWRPASGEWFILRSEDNSFHTFPFGATGDIPRPGDFDGDGLADATVFRPSNGTWYSFLSDGSGISIQQFGIAGDVPVVSDYDGDGLSDIAVFRPSTGVWWINRSSQGVIAYQFGNSADKPVPADYTGDGKTDVAIWRPSSGEWFVLRSENLSYYSVPFGTNGDIPAPSDYDGDGQDDLAIFRPSSGTWYILRTTAGLLIQQFGSADSIPVASAYIP